MGRKLYGPVPAREPGEVLGVEVEASVEMNRRRTPPRNAIGTHPQIAGGRSHLNNMCAPFVPWKAKFSRSYVETDMRERIAHDRHVHANRAVTGTPRHYCSPEAMLEYSASARTCWLVEGIDIEKRAWEGHCMKNTLQSRGHCTWRPIGAEARMAIGGALRGSCRL